MIRRFADHDVFVGVISAGAPYNVHRWHEAYLGKATWFVPQEEWARYREHRPSAMRPGSNKCSAPARNQALKAAFRLGLPCLMLDDDPIAAYQVKEQRAKRIAWPQLFNRLVSLHFEHGTSLSYANRNTNTHFIKDEFSFKPKLSTGCFIVNPCDLLFDEQLVFADDMDYGLQHVETYGQILRVDSLIAHMEMDTGEGTVVDQRTEAAKTKERHYLQKKWEERIIFRKSKHRSDVQLRPKARQREILK
jgi:hypothetical protein